VNETMPLAELFPDPDDSHPIDAVETLAARREWDFERLADDRIAMAVKGQWRIYSITLAWPGEGEPLRLICAFEIDPPDSRLSALYDVLNRANDMCWAGGFTYWPDQHLIAYRYDLILADDQMAGTDQISTLIDAAVISAERFYPAFQLVVWEERPPSEAMQAAIATVCGHA